MTSDETDVDRIFPSEEIVPFNVMRPGQDGQVRYDKRRAKHRVILERKNGMVCPLCGDLIKPAERSIDHITPVVKGGSRGLENLQLTHKECNNVKGDITDMDELLQFLFKRHRAQAQQIKRQAEQLDAQRAVIKNRNNKVANLKYKLRKRSDESSL